jgi:chromosome segregation ATPase
MTSMIKDRAYWNGQKDLLQSLRGKKLNAAEIASKLEEIDAELEYTTNEGNALVARYGPLRLIHEQQYEGLLATTQSFDEALSEAQAKLKAAEAEIRALMEPRQGPRLGGPIMRESRKRGAGVRGGAAGAAGLKRCRTMGGGREDSQ